MVETIQDPTQLRARKEHRCNHCGQTISKGEYYLRSVYKYDYVYTWKEHIHCHDLVKKLKIFENCDGEGVTSDDFRETVSNEYEIITEINPWTTKVPWTDRLKTVLEYHAS